MKRVLNLGSLSRIVEGDPNEITNNEILIIGIKEAASALNLNHSNISAALTKSGRHRTCGGFKWEYYGITFKKNS